MKLIVPAVFQLDFLEAIAGSPIDHLYGAMGGDVGLRAQNWLAQPKADDIASYIEAAHGRGIAFFYCLNVACLGNREYTAEGQRWLVEHLGWLDDLGVDGVVLSNPYVISFAHRRFPRLKIAASTALGIDSVDKARFFEEQGAGVLYLPEFINRDIPLLAQIRKRTRAEIVLLANVGCLSQCPIRNYHINLVSHSRDSLELGTYVDYPLMWCTREKVRDGAQMLKAPWIRPEDLGAYEKIGIAQFKLAGREMDRPWVERVTKAYAARRYDGELNDLILGFDHLEPYGQVPVRIPNRALDDFAGFFRKKHDCRVGCRDCTYCDDFARESGLAAGGNAPGFVRRLDRAIARFESGAFRTASGK